MWLAKNQWQQAIGIFIPSVCLHLIQSWKQTNKNQTLHYNLTSRVHLRTVNESAVNEETFSQMPKNRGSNNIYHTIKMSFSIISALIIVRIISLV